MFLLGGMRKTAQAGDHPRGCIASSSLGEQEAVHRLPRGGVRAYADGRTSSTKPSNDGVPGPESADIKG